MPRRKNPGRAGKWPNPHYFCSQRWPATSRHPVRSVSTPLRWAISVASKPTRPDEHSTCRNNNIAQNGYSPERQRSQHRLRVADQGAEQGKEKRLAHAKPAWRPDDQESTQPTESDGADQKDRWQCVCLQNDSKRGRGDQEENQVT